MIYSKRRTNLGRRSKKSFNRTLKRLIGGSSSSSSIEYPNDIDKLPEGFSPFNVYNVAKGYPKGTEILKINKDGKRTHITLNKYEILQFNYLGDTIIGFKKPVTNSINKPRNSTKAVVERYQQQQLDKLKDEILARRNYGTD